MGNVRSLNPALNALLETYPEVDLDRLDFQAEGKHLCQSLRACRTDAETAHVLHTLTPRLTSATQNGSPQQIWTLLDHMFSCLSMQAIPKRPRKKHQPSPDESRTGLAELMVSNRAALLEASDELNRTRLVGAEEYRRHALRHVPLGRNKWFETLREYGIAHDFQRALDDHLSRLVPLYLVDPPSQAPATSPETISLVRTLLQNLLDGLVVVSKRLRDSGVSDVSMPHGAKATVDALSLAFEHFRALNLLAFDALYQDPEVFAAASLQTYLSAHTEQLNIIMGAFQSVDDAAPGPEVAVVSRADNERKAVGPGFSTTLALTLLAGAHAKDPDSLAVAAGLPITFEPELVTPSLRHRLTWEWLDHGNADLFPRDGFPLVAPGSDVPAGPLARATAVAAMLSGTPGRPSGCAPVLDALQISARAPTLDELAEGLSRLDAVCLDGECKFGDGSELFDGLDEHPGDYLELGSQLFKRLRKAPKTGERLHSPQFSLWASGEQEWFRLLNASVTYENLRWSPLFAIAYAFGLEVFASSEDVNKYYMAAVRTCLREDLALTASHLLCYFLVTCRVQAVGYGSPDFAHKDSDAVTFVLAKAISKSVQALLGKVVMDGIHEALEVAREAHSIYNELPEGTLDFFGETLVSLQDLVAKRSPPNLTPSPSTPLSINEIYAKRLNQLTGGYYATFPEKLRSRIQTIELDREQNMRGRSFADPDKKRDLPWVVSYHKLLEGILRSKLEFLYDVPHRHWLELANPQGVGSRYEAFKVLRVLEAAHHRQPRYGDLVDNLAGRGILVSDAAPFFREYVEKSKQRNQQAHDYGTLGDADTHREWILGNLHRALKIFSIHDLTDFPGD